LSAQVQEKMCNIELCQYQQLNTEAKRQLSKTIFRAGGRMITFRDSLLAIRYCEVTRAHTRTTPHCYIDQPVTFVGRALFRKSNSWILMASSYQVPSTPGQEPIHNINGIFKAQKSEEIFAKARGVGGASSHLTKIYSDGENIFQSTNQFIAHHQRLAPPCSQMRQKADVPPFHASLNSFLLSDTVTLSIHHFSYAYYMF
jgi:hypothetical protein